MVSESLPSEVRALLQRIYPLESVVEVLPGGFSGASVLRVRFEGRAEVLKCHGTDRIRAEERGINLFRDLAYAVRLVGQVESQGAVSALRLNDCGELRTLKDVVLGAIESPNSADAELVAEAVSTLFGQPARTSASCAKRSRGVAAKPFHQSSCGVLAWMMRRGCGERVDLATLGQWAVLDGSGPFNGLGAQRVLLEGAIKQVGGRPLCDLEAALIVVKERVTASAITAPTCLGHGDLSGANILIGPDEFHIIDFDRADAAMPRWSDWANMISFFLTVYLTIPIPVQHLTCWPCTLPAASLKKVGVWLTGRTDCEEVGKEMLRASEAAMHSDCSVTFLSNQAPDDLRARLSHRLANSEEEFRNDFDQARKLACWVAVRVSHLGQQVDMERPHVSGRCEWMLDILEPFMEFAGEEMCGDERVAILYMLLHASLHKLTFPALSPHQKSLVVEVVGAFAEQLLLLFPQTTKESLTSST